AELKMGPVVARVEQDGVIEGLDRPRMAVPALAGVRSGEQIVVAGADRRRPVRLLLGGAGSRYLSQPSQVLRPGLPQGLRRLQAGQTLRPLQQGQRLAQCLLLPTVEVDFRSG